MWCIETHKISVENTNNLVKDVNFAVSEIFQN